MTALEVERTWEKARHQIDDLNHSLIQAREENEKHLVSPLCVGNLYFWYCYGGWKFAA